MIVLTHLNATYYAIILCNKIVSETNTRIALNFLCSVILEYSKTRNISYEDSIAGVNRKHYYRWMVGYIAGLFCL